MDIKLSIKSSDYYVIEGTEVSAEHLIAPIATAEPEQESMIPKNLSFFKRLTTDTVFLSGRQKCLNMLMSLADGASSVVSHKKVKELSERVSAFENEFSPDIVESCRCILRILRDYNHRTLIHERWLIETHDLLENKRLTIGVFGRHKAGKSTLLNALLHQEVLSHAVTNETAFILSIIHVPHKDVSKNCASICEESLSMHEKSENVYGRRAIKNLIKKNNKANRTETSFVVKHETMTAHVPFLCNSSTSNINVELMDTPGLSESNKLGISELAEHQLMTCSAFVYVISCLQLQDAVDSESFEAILKRDPGVFIEKRLLIVVTRLDEYKIPVTICNDNTVADDDEDENIYYTIEEVISSIKSTVKNHFKEISEIPDDCIIPVCASGANEARKASMNIKYDCDKELLVFKKMLGRRINEEELEALSQIKVLEEKLGYIATDAPRIWKYSIARDCCRYLDQSVTEIISIERELKACRDSYNEKVAKKRAIITSYIKEKEALRSKYEHMGDFHKKLELAYDNDIESHFDDIKKAYMDKFEEFCASIKSKKKITLEDYCEETKKFIETTNQETKSELSRMKFKQLDGVINKANVFLGGKQQKLVSLMSSFCETEDINGFDELKDVDETEQSMSDMLNTDHSDNKYDSPKMLEFKDLVTKSKSENLTFF
uniref:Dynamin N-terminal domain-containing protein n=1 Tax=Amphimedon queenslandica TaxID=400682 RepID=A0A1X7TWY2_AMPQE